MNQAVLHLMTIPSVLEEEVLDLGRDLASVETHNETYLSRRQEGTPLLDEFAEHAERSAFLHLAEAAKYRQLIVGHTHIGLTLDMVRGLCNAPRPLGHKYQRWAPARLWEQQ